MPARPGLKPAARRRVKRHHALFVCYGPVDNPRYACAVIVEHGMAGGATAGPIGRDVLVETMKRDPSRRSDRFRKMASR